MIRRAFTMRLKPGAMAEYKQHHDNIWPELVREVEASGIARITTFEADPVLFLFSEIADEDAWNKLWTSEIHRKWGEVMEPLMHFKDGIVDFGELREIFNLETSAGQGRSGRAGSRSAAARSKSSSRSGGRKSSRATASTKKPTRKAAGKKTGRKRATRSR
jgi:L-rhamnose mutarotase